MERDNKLIRLILLQVEKKENDYDIDVVTIEGYPPKVVNYHVGLLSQAGMLDAVDHYGGDQHHWFVRSLTWQGHEYLDLVRDDKRFIKLESVMSKLGGFVYEVAKSVLVEIMKRQALALFP